MRSSSHSPAAAARTTRSASSTDGFVFHCQAFISMNTLSVTQAAHLLPSSKGWFLTNRTRSYGGFVTEGGVELLVAEGACRAESARSSVVAFKSVLRSTPVTAAAMARKSAKSGYSTLTWQGVRAARDPP